MPVSGQALDMAEANVVYESHDDGDLMEMLFGVVSKRAAGHGCL